MRYEKPPTVEIIAIGCELLDGTVVDTNTAYIGRSMVDVGANVVRATIVPDRARAITAAIRRAMADSDVVITTGGLGPTADDRTKQAVAALLGARLILDEDTLRHVREHFERRGVPMPEVNVGQAMLPEGVATIRNEQGTAPGLLAETDDGVLFALPGVPSEMRPMVDGSIVPYLTERGLRRLTEERVLRTTGISESAIAESIATLTRRLARTTIAYLPSETGVDLRIEAQGDTPDDAARAADLATERVSEKLAHYVYTTGTEPLERIVGYLLALSGKTVAVAESCTAGALGAKLTMVPGSSEYFKGGVIVYSNDLKTRLLGVKQETLSTNGAVSPEVAAEMAVRARANGRSDYGVAITGIAGPGGGTPDKPVGLVYVGISSVDGHSVREFHFGGDRAQVRARATQAALEALRRTLLGLDLG